MSYILLGGTIGGEVVATVATMSRDCRATVATLLRLRSPLLCLLSSTLRTSLSVLLLLGLDSLDSKLNGFWRGAEFAHAAHQFNDAHDRLHSSGVRSRLAQLHDWHAVTRFSMTVRPPRLYGITWSQ